MKSRNRSFPSDLHFSVLKHERSNNLGACRDASFQERDLHPAHSFQLSCNSTKIINLAVPALHLLSFNCTPGLIQTHVSKPCQVFERKEYIHKYNVSKWNHFVNIWKVMGCEDGSNLTDCQTQLIISKSFYQHCQFAFWMTFQRGIFQSYCLDPMTACVSLLISYTWTFVLTVLV